MLNHLKKYWVLLYGTSLCFTLSAQPNIVPSGVSNKPMYITHALVHVGDGRVLNDVVIQIENGKIKNIGTDITIPQDADTLNAAGQQVYPGLILSNTLLGLQEIAEGVKGSNDYTELAQLNPSVRAISAYNADSKVINTLRSNGVLLANIVPEGGLMSGSSSVVQLDAWNNVDAAYHIDGGIHVYMPSFTDIEQPNEDEKSKAKRMEKAFADLEVLKVFLSEAQAYWLDTTAVATPNLKLEAVKTLFNKTASLFVHTDEVKGMLFAIGLAKTYRFKVVIVGGAESWQIADLLKQNNLSVILGGTHNPVLVEGDNINQPYITPSLLEKAGVLYAINDAHELSRYRNIAFSAGTAAAYGLTKEEALSCITLRAAKILGIDHQTGSIEVGKDANIIVSTGDILDMRSNQITHALIQGRPIDLTSVQTMLYKRYTDRYKL